jgi:hypothetical protein
LVKLSEEEIEVVYKKYYQWIVDNLGILNVEYYNRYAKIFTNK